MDTPIPNVAPSGPEHSPVDLSHTLTPLITELNAQARFVLKNILSQDLNCSDTIDHLNKYPFFGKIMLLLGDTFTGQGVFNDLKQQMLKSL